MKFKKLNKCYSFSGKFNYIFILDLNSGRKNVYTIIALNVEDPVIVGREIPYKEIKQLIESYEELAPEIWFGDRKAILTMLKKYKKLHNSI